MAAAIQIFQGGLSLYQAYEQSNAIKAQDRFQRQQAATNKRMKQIQAEDAIKRGELESRRIKQETGDVIGSQRAAYAAQGVDVGSGTPLAVVTETGTAGEMDALTAKNNAWREAWGYRVEAANIAAESRMRSLAAKQERRMSLLTGGLQAASSFAQAGYASGGRSSGFVPRNQTERQFNNDYRSSRR